MSQESPSPAPIVLDRRLHHHQHHHPSSPPLLLSLTAEERTRSRHLFATDNNIPVYLHLPRGTTLQDGDLLSSESGDCLVKVIAKAEPVLTITSDNILTLQRAAYHLGNRHVSLEIAPTYLRLAPDSVLEAMLLQLGVEVVPEVAPFCPEGGAYAHHH